MKRLFVIIYFLFVFANIANALPKCVGSWSVTTWDNCFGTRVYQDGDKFVGEYKDGTLNGYGTYYYLKNNKWKGDKFVGEFKNGGRHGYGTYYHLGNKPAKGTIFIGNYQNDALHGRGMTTFASGDKFIGEYKYGKRSGYGTYYYLKNNEWKGDKFIGEYKNDLQNGKGIYYHLANTKWKGSIFVGEYKDGKRSGQGIFIGGDGAIKEGIWKDGVYQSSEKVPKEEKYKLELVLENLFKNKTFEQRIHIQSILKEKKYYLDKIDGEWGANTKYAVLIYQGKLQKVINSHHVGLFLHEILHTPNTSLGNDTAVCGMAVTMKNNMVVWGSKNEFKKYVTEAKRRHLNCGVGQSDILAATKTNGFPKCVGSWSVTSWHNCVGTYIWENGTKYVGEYKDGRKNGQGTTTWDDGTKYVGEYKDGKQHGQGTTTFANGHKYVGNYKDGKKNGQGTLTFTNGNKHVGQYKNDKRSGKGTFTFSDGKNYVGEFKDDKYHGQGTFTFADRSKWVGAWENSKLNGYAITYYPNGNINQEGIFKDGKFLYAQKKPSSNTQIAQKTCDNDPELCSVAQLCKKASVSSGGKKVWRSAYSSKRYVTLAKDLGISCGVKEVVKVETPKIDKTYKVASGTGFYVSGTGHVITNDHVIAGCNNVKIQSKGSIINTRLLGTDTKVDLALLKADFKPSLYFAISDNPAEELDEIIVAGFPFGDYLSSTIKFTKGVVSSLAGIGDDYSQIQIDAALQKGNSGGPIIDQATGNIVGVAVAKLDHEKLLKDLGAVAENTNFGIKASSVKNIMRGNNVIPKTSNTKQISISELRSLAKEATVHLTCWMTRAQLEKILEKEKGKVLFKEFTD